MILSFLVLLCAINIDGAQEGDICDKGGTTGKCTSIKKCPEALQDVVNKKRPQLCEFGGLVPTVCCSISEATTPSIVATLTTTKRTPVPATLQRPLEDGSNNPPDKGGAKCVPMHISSISKWTGQKAWHKCVEYQEKLVFPCIRSPELLDEFSRHNRCHHSDEPVIGNEAAALNEFPHIVQLGYGDDPTNLQWLCSGSFISDRFVLTAGHCTSSRDGGDVTYVLLGYHRRRRVKNIFKHPAYNPALGYHDIALLELQELIPLNEFTVPACIYSEYSNDAMNDAPASVAGWALAAYNRKPSDSLQKVSLTKLEAVDCAATYKPNRLLPIGFNATTQICYKNKEISTDTCQGDIGGPLQMKNQQITCMYKILGVTSRATECGNGVPGLYTRVAHYLDWIERTVWP